ncbi:Them4 [Symbiodinium natans]|uniref:Them4 protein n=1 Tax=Symbiodinium natans TaxID=878477 RepID=A0A812J284_9DINO|nr:Them4 [Symbiodinium natans]
MLIRSQFGKSTSVRRSAPVRQTSMLMASCPKQQDAVLLDFMNERREEILGKRKDKQFIWQTCTGPRRIEECRIFHCRRGDVDREVSLDGPEAVEGKTRICCVIKVGDELNGHPGLLHGGFSAAIIDDFTGLATWIEKDAQDLGKDVKIFTAHLDLSYRRPLRSNSEYLVEVCVDRLERGKKVFLNAAIYDDSDHACVKGRALYIIKA